MKKLLNKNAIIAIIVIAALAVLYWGIEFLKGVNLFKPSNFYVAKFENVNGLNISSPVMVNGFQVGLVREMNFDYANNTIAVEMSLDENLKVPIGSTATLGSDLLGTASIVINLSDQKVYHKPGDTIQSAIKTGLMDKLSKDVMPEVGEMMPQINDILENVNKLVGNPALRQGVGRIDPITNQLAQSAVQLNDLMHKLNNIVGGAGGQIQGVFTDVHGVTTQLGTTMGKLDGTANKLDGTMTNVQDLSGHLNTTVQQLPLDQLATTITQLNKTLDNLEKLTADLNYKLNSDQSSIGLLMNDRALYDNANSTVMSLDSLFKDIKKNPKRYVTIKVF